LRLHWWEHGRKLNAHECSKMEPRKGLKRVQEGQPQWQRSQKKWKKRRKKKN